MSNIKLGVDSFLIFKEYIYGNVIYDFYLCVANCKSELDKLLEEVPHDWKISIDTKRTAILESIFTPRWLNDVFLNFLIYLKQLL